MYFPYLRGRQHEIAAVRETAAKIAASGKLVPIIEPVNARFDALERGVADILEAGASLVVITNPQVGDLEGNADVLAEAPFKPHIKNKKLVPGHIVLTQTTAAQVNAFLKRYANRPVAFIHLETPAAPIEAQLNASGVGATTHVVREGVAKSFVKKLKGRMVTLSDRFERQVRNADYPPDEFYSDDHLTFAANAFDGFSDYSIVGEAFTEGGGAAHAVAIHLHHKTPNGLWVRHFLSDRTVGRADPGGKFAEAVAKLDAFAGANAAVAATDACAAFRQHHVNGHFPGLGVVKQLSIRHHIETLAAIL